jgi:hypothetical protein
MRVRLREPRLAGELSAALQEAGCVSVAIDVDELSVLHPLALDAREESLELTFFLRAWQASRAAARLDLQT